MLFACVNFAFAGEKGSSFLYGDADGDGSLTAADGAIILQRVLDEGAYVPLQDKTEDYLKYLDTDGNGVLTADDSALVLQKSLDKGFLMPKERETTTETTTEATTEVISQEITYLDFDECALGQYESPYTVKGFTLTSKEGNTLEVIQSPAALYDRSYTNAVDGSSTKIDFTLDRQCDVRLFGSGLSGSSAITISGSQSDGKEYMENRIVLPIFTQTGDAVCAEAFVLSAGTYSIDCRHVNVNYIELKVLENKETTTEATTEDIAWLDFGEIALGQYESPYTVKGFTLVSKEGDYVEVAESPWALGKTSYTNAVDGNSTQINYTLHKKHLLAVKGLGMGNIEITGKTADGQAYWDNRACEPLFTETGAAACNESFCLDAGTYSMDFKGINISCIEVAYFADMEEEE